MDPRQEQIGWLGIPRELGREWLLSYLSTPSQTERGKACFPYSVHPVTYLVWTLSIHVCVLLPSYCRSGTGDPPLDEAVMMDWTHIVLAL